MSAETPLPHPFAGREAVFRGELHSRLEEREGMIEEILRSLTAAGCRPDPFFDRLILDEAISNAILHGNARDPAKMVTVRLFVCPDRWGVEIGDEGKGFAWKAQLERIEKATEPEALAAASGRGLALIQASGAELNFLDGGRRLVIVRARDKAGEAARRKTKGGRQARS